MKIKNRVKLEKKGGMMKIIKIWNLAELTTLIEKWGQEKVARKLQKGKISLENIEKIFFDKRGRRILEDITKDISFMENKLEEDYQKSKLPLPQPSFKTLRDYSNRLQRLHKFLGIDTGITAEEFKMETECLLTSIKSNHQIKNIAKGMWLPIVMPKLENNNLRGDGNALGETLRQYLRAAAKSYLNELNYDSSARVSNIYHSREGLRIFKEIGYENLISMTKKKSVIGISFPTALYHLSIDIQREQIAMLPQDFFLYGIERVIEMIMYPDIYLDIFWRKCPKGSSSFGSPSFNLPSLYSCFEFETNSDSGVYFSFGGSGTSWDHCWHNFDGLIYCKEE